MAEDIYHIPALLEPTLDGLNIKKNGIYVDATLGGAGHTRAILDRLGPNGRLFSFDQDIEAIERAPHDPRLTTVHSNFCYLLNFMDFYGVDGKVDGILADLGVSFHHFDDATRGFSFRADGPLDMRMNPDARLSAADIVANADEDKLTEIFRIYGELKQARRIAHRLIDLRSVSPVTTTGQLTEAVAPLLNPAREKKELAQVFQALRIEVNSEMNVLATLLSSSLATLTPGGRLAIITYHSLEDRMVKNFMRTGTITGREVKDFFGNTASPIHPLTSKPVVPDNEEIERNPRSRSAKLRVGIKL